MTFPISHADWAGETPQKSFRFNCHFSDLDDGNSPEEWHEADL
jgi:hypothetical protein